MRVEITKETPAEAAGGVVVYRLDGRLDAASSSQFESVVSHGIGADGATRIALDLSALSYISSAGLRAVLVAAKQARAAKGAVVLFGLQEMTREVFDISGFGRIMQIVDTEAEALAALAI